MNTAVENGMVKSGLLMRHGLGSLFPLEILALSIYLGISIKFTDSIKVADPDRCRIKDRGGSVTFLLVSSQTKRHGKDSA